MIVKYINRGFKYLHVIVTSCFVFSFEIKLFLHLINPPRARSAAVFVVFGGARYLALRYLALLDTQKNSAPRALGGRS